MGTRHATPAERAARGRAAREEVPRRSHAHFRRATEHEPIALLEEQARTRLPELVPIRHGRMLESPFAFFRGAAIVMAADLASTPRSGIHAQLCGDAHLANFGGFASPERRLVFDLNDFDETLPGPWEWDVKRLAASLEVAGRDRGFRAGDRRDAVLTVTRSYREAMAELAGMRELDVWYADLDLEARAEHLTRELGRAAARDFRKGLERARRKDSRRALERLTRIVDGRPRLVSDPPLLVHMADLLPPGELATFERDLRRWLRRYAETLQSDRRVLFERFEHADFARKVVGVGSVGTRAWVLLMLGRDDRDPLVLQVKEAQRSVLEPFLGKSPYQNRGERVVAGQRAMQTVSDIFLGWLRARGLDGVTRDYYVRQLWDWKLSPDLSAIDQRAFAEYATMCGWALARAHARSGDRIAIASYLGSGTVFDRALAEFAVAYADRNEADYDLLRAAVKSGRLQAERG